MIILINDQPHELGRCFNGPFLQVEVETLAQYANIEPAKQYIINITDGRHGQFEMVVSDYHRFEFETHDSPRVTIHARQQP